jgi:hypothetical protein
VDNLGQFIVGDQWGGYIAAHPGDVDNFNNAFRVLESAEFLRLSHGLILAFVSADPVLGNPIRLA